MSKTWIQAVVGTVALTVLQMALSFLVPPSAGQAAGALGLVIVSNALAASVLAWIGARLRARGLARALVLGAIWGGILAADWVETLLFDIGIPRADLPWLVAYTLSCSAGLALVLGALRPAPASGNVPAVPAAPGWWRLVVCDLLYIALYFGAGRLVWPYLRAFYESRPMPSAAAVAALQVFRGLWFAAIALLIARQMRTSRAQAALAAGLALAILGGVAPLLIPNPYLPDTVRWAHMPETSVSNFLFGLVAGWLLAPPAAEPVTPRAMAPASA